MADSGDNDPGGALDAAIAECLASEAAYNDDAAKARLLRRCVRHARGGGAGALRRLDMALLLAGSAAAADVDEAAAAAGQLHMQLGGGESSDEDAAGKTPPLKRRRVAINAALAAPTPHPRLRPLPLVETAVSWAATRWTDAVLTKAAGRRLVPVEVGATMADATTEYMPLQQLLRHLRCGRRDVYMAQHKLTRQVAELRGDVGVPKGVPCEGAEAHPNLFIGPAGSFTPLHTDPAHNVFVQLVGEKYLRMHPPMGITAAALAAAREDPDAAHVLKRIDDGTEVALPDLSAGCAGTLRPGDAVCIPQGWFHTLTAATRSVSAAYWYTS